MKFVQTSYGNKTEILKYGDHYLAIPVMVSATGITANADGKKIVSAGTIVGGSANPVLTNLNEPVVTKNTTELGSAAEGVLLNDVDVTYGNASGAMIIHGFIDLNKLAAAPVAAAVTALKQITFVK